MHLSTPSLHAELPIAGFVVIATVVLLMAGLIYVGYTLNKKRREALQQLATELGLQYTAARDRDLAKKYAKLDAIRRGSNRYGFNLLHGTWKGLPVEIFDYHYQIRQSTGKSSSTRHYHLSVLVCQLPRAFPETRIYREGFLEKLVQMVGFEDIEFESAEFSRRYTVRSKSRKFAYDFLHARMIDYLLNVPDLNIEIEDHALAIVTPRRLKPQEIPVYLEHLGQLRTSMPAYLFA